MNMFIDPVNNRQPESEPESESLEGDDEHGFDALQISEETLIPSPPPISSLFMV